MGLKCVFKLRVLRVVRRGPLKTSVSRKTVRSDDVSQVNLIVGWTGVCEVNEVGEFFHGNLP